MTLGKPTNKCVWEKLLNGENRKWEKTKYYKIYLELAIIKTLSNLATDFRV